MMCGQSISEMQNLSARHEVAAVPDSAGLFPEMLR
jgi:hypothetical protein